MGICEKHKKMEEQGNCGWCESRESEDAHTRDDFAGTAMSSLLNVFIMQKLQMKMNLGDTANPVSISFGETNYDEVATEAYLMADAMMRTRGRKDAQGLLINVLREHGGADAPAFDLSNYGDNAKVLCATPGCPHPPESNLRYCRGHEGGFTMDDPGQTRKDAAAAAPDIHEDGTISTSGTCHHQPKCDCDDCGYGSTPRKLLPPAFIESRGDGVSVHVPIRKRAFCSVCSEPQYMTSSGNTCPEGHGGAPSK